MLRLITFIHYEIIIMYTECGACAYANYIFVRAVRVRRRQINNATFFHNQS